jgi:hypothetical protein
MKRKWLHKIIGGISFTSLLFIFQACYGTPQDIGNDVLVEGQVKSKTTGQPIKGIKVSSASGTQYQQTDDAGKFSFYSLYVRNLGLRFEDIDSTLNGAFLAKDTILSDIADKVWVDIKLEDK